MPLPVYPLALPSPSPLFIAADRGVQNFIYTNVQATNSTVSTVSGSGPVAAPVNATVLAMPSIFSKDGANYDTTIQVDPYVGSAVIVALGSIDGVNFYSLGAVVPGLNFLSNQKVKYLTAAVVTYTGSGGTTDSQTVSAYI